MQVYDAIASAQGGAAIANLAQVFRISPAEADAALKAVLPELVSAIERNTLSRGGLADVVEALGHGHHEAMLEDPRLLFTTTAQADGNEVLGHILGSKDRSRGIAMRAAQATGLSDGLIKMLLPFIAQMLMGAISKATRGGLGDILSRLPGGQPGGRTRPVPWPRDETSGGDGGFGLPRGGLEPPAGGGYPMPPIPGDPDGGRNSDRDGDWSEPEQPRGGRRRGPDAQPFPFPMPGSDPEGSPFPWPGGRHRSGRPDQEGYPGSGGQGGFELPRGGLEPPPGGGYPMPPIPGGPGGYDEADRSGETGSRRGGDLPFPFPLPGGDGGQPLPLPRGGDNPYGDLSDILRRGAGGAAGGGMLWTLVRSLLGSVLGFGGRGFMGWIIRLLVMRFGWGLIRRMFGRVLGVR